MIFETFIEKKIAMLQEKCQTFQCDSVKMKAHIRLVNESIERNTKSQICRSKSEELFF